MTDKAVGEVTASLRRDRGSSTRKRVAAIS